MKVLVFAGSTRIASFNRKLASEAAAIARERGAEVTHLELGDYELPMYNADLEARGTPPDVMKLKQLFWEHPAWIVCTPEYNASYPALLKNTLDWLSSPVKGDPIWSDDFRSSRGKVVGVNNNTDFYRAVREGRMTSTATPLHRGRLQQVWVVETEDPEGRTVARGQVRLQNLYPQG